MTDLHHRLATRQDIPAIKSLMSHAITELQRGFLTPEQIKASQAVMGLDTQLIDDGCYLLICSGDEIAGCGGWSNRATLYGGDHSGALRDARLLDPASDPARIRAMFTAPSYARRGVGRMLLALCEAAARTAGFKRAEMMATLSGEPLYLACGYSPIQRTAAAPVNGVAVPLVRMGKTL